MFLLRVLINDRQRAVAEIGEQKGAAEARNGSAAGRAKVTKDGELGDEQRTH
jgi:hypothetical protein